MNGDVRIVLGLLTCGLLSSCNGGGGNGGGSEEANAFCHTIPVQSFNCSNCTQVSDSPAAFDGHFGTSAALGPGGQGSFVGVSEVQPAGSMAGVSFVLPNPAGISVTITTFLGGVQQDASAPVTRQTPNDNCSGLQMECHFRDGGESFVGMGTTRDYDSIQATISNTSAGTIDVSELCVR